MKIMWALLASALLSSFFVTSPANAAEPHKMIVPYTPLTGASTPFWIAIEGKLFQKYGLEIAPLFISAGSSAIVPAMTAGQFDIGAVGGGAVVLNRFSGGDLITIGAQTGVYTIDCFSKPEINSIVTSREDHLGDPLRNVNSLRGTIHATYRWPQTNGCRFRPNRGQLGSHCRAFER
jgi:ABC-type nitrate/sulfonate/bicarbonate transport system substrate-binding protein